MKDVFEQIRETTESTTEYRKDWYRDECHDYEQRLKNDWDWGRVFHDNDIVTHADVSAFWNKGGENFIRNLKPMLPVKRYTKDEIKTLEDKMRSEGRL